MLLAVLIFLGVLLSREASTMEALPAFLPCGQDFYYVEITGDGLESGVHQFYDALPLRDVIKMTIPSFEGSLIVEPAWMAPLSAGEKLEIFRKEQQIRVLRRSWMSATHRVAMAIPLHPDQMSVEDWAFLPGIGATLAERIEIDRQKNGEFGRLDALIRVKGVGKKHLGRWEEFFE